MSDYIKADDDAEELLKELPSTEELARVKEAGSQNGSFKQDHSFTSNGTSTTTVVSFRRPSLAAPTASSSAGARVVKAV